MHCLSVDCDSRWYIGVRLLSELALGAPATFDKAAIYISSRSCLLNFPPIAATRSFETQGAIPTILSDWEGVEGIHVEGQP